MSGYLFVANFPSSIYTAGGVFSRLNRDRPQSSSNLPLRFAKAKPLAERRGGICRLVISVFSCGESYLGTDAVWKYRHYVKTS